MAYLNLSEPIPDNSLIFLELSYNDQTRTIYCKPNFTSPDYIQDRSWVSLHYRIAVRKVRDSSRIFMVTENFANHSRVEADFVNLLRFDNEVQERVPNRWDKYDEIVDFHSNCRWRVKIVNLEDNEQSYWTQYLPAFNERSG